MLSLVIIGIYIYQYTENVGRPPFWEECNVTKTHATARGLQLPKCSINQRGQQPIADE